MCEDAPNDPIPVFAVRLFDDDGASLGGVCIHTSLKGALDAVEADEELLADGGEWRIARVWMRPSELEALPDFEGY